MSSSMTTEAADDSALLERAAGGDQDALSDLFARYRDRLKRMIRLRLSLRLVVQEALNTMDPLDREVLALKHFEQLSTSEIAEVLGLSKAGAGSRYLRAIKRLREILSQVPGFEEL